MSISSVRQQSSTSTPTATPTISPMSFSAVLGGGRGVLVVVAGDDREVSSGVSD